MVRLSTTVTVSLAGHNIHAVRPVNNINQLNQQISTSTLIEINVSEDDNIR